MLYDRKIKYLDYLENGERVRGGGFVKLELLGDSLKAELAVKGVRCAKGFVGDVIFCGAGKEEVLGKIQIEEGAGEFRYMGQVQSGIGGAGIGYDELNGVRIPLGDGREIACTWNAARPAAEEPVRKKGVWELRKPKEPDRQEKVQKPRKPEEPVRQAAVQELRKSEEPVRQAAVQELRKSEKPVGQGAVQELRKQEESVRQGAVGELRKQEEPVREETVRELRKQEEPVREETVRDPRKPEEPETVSLPENKWLQICAIYPHIKPFRDQREYLSIGPEDFVLLSADSYKAANNSFMMHGYYNYRHLILTRVERRGENQYYVGVPGNYYDREKQVAIMFGFESFECAQEPAQSADFGYYMMKVQI